MHELPETEPDLQLNEERATEIRRPKLPTQDLPAFLKRQSVDRLKFLSGSTSLFVGVIWLVPVFLRNDVANEFSSVVWWGPETLIITVSFIVFVLAASRRVSNDAVLNLALVYQAVVSFGIAFAQYWGRFEGTAIAELTSLDDLLGFSYVAFWMLFFSAFVPNRPLPALVALLVSACAVPTVYLVASFIGDNPVFPPFRFFLAFVFPYVCCAGAAYMGARMMYQLGAAVNEARQMGSYQLVSLLGQGGMGEVWRAKHRMLARPAAVKLIRDDSLQSVPTRVFDAAYKRFEEEAQATASLRSPHVVELYDYGRAEDGTFYYVMELLDGIDLQELVVRHGSLPPERAVHFLKQICHALGEAHQNGLIHRDIKPANLVACQFGREYDFIKVLDFGLVQISGLESGSTPSQTQRALAGTPGYLAPEILGGRAEADRRSDIYSLGCVAYWLLTGRMVFEGTNTSEILQAHLAQEPRAPSLCGGSTIPPSLDRVVLNCLEKNPDKRLQDVDQLLDAILSCDVQADWTQERSRHWWKNCSDINDVAG